MESAGRGRGNDQGPFGGGATGPNPTDRAKSGTKRSILTDAAGVPIGLAIAGANTPDMKLLQETIDSIPVDRPRIEDVRQHLSLDKGYDYLAIYALIDEEQYVGHVAQRTNSPVPALKRGTRQTRARRWVVERTHGWMNRFRRILTRWEKKAANYVGLLQFVCGIIAFRAAGVLG